MESKIVKPPAVINANDREIDGVYSNVFFIAVSRAEFVLDFARVVPGVNGARLKARIIVSPYRMKALVQALQSQIESYESKFGKLEGEGSAAFGFQNRGNNPVIEQE